MRVEKVDFLNSTYGGDFKRFIYIPKRCVFKVINTTNGATTTVTTEDAHCLSTGDTVQLCLGHADGCKVITFDQQWVVTRVDDNNFTIPYDSADCGLALSGEGFEPQDLTSILYTADIFEAKSTPFSGGFGGSIEAGDSVARLEGNASDLSKLSQGSELTIEGAVSGTILGVSSVTTPDNQNCRSKDLPYATVYLDTAASKTVSNRGWHSSWVESNKIGKKIIDAQVATRPTYGEIIFGFNTDSLQSDRLYFYRIYEVVGPLKTARFFGQITWGDEELNPSGVVSAGVSAYPVTVTDPGLISNVQINVPSLDALASLPSGLVINTARTALGHDNAGDMVYSRYLLRPKNGRSEIRPYLVNYTADSSLIWVRQGEILSTPELFGATPDNASDATAAFNAAASRTQLLVHPGYDPGDKFRLDNAPNMGDTTILSMMADALSGAGASDLDAINYLELAKGRFKGHVGHPHYRDRLLDVRFGVLRYFPDWDGNGNQGWDWINDASHEPCGFYLRADPDAPAENFEIDPTGLLELSYTHSSSKNGTLLATADESFSQWNMVVGGSVGVAQAKLRANIDKQVSCNTRWTGSAWSHSTLSGLGAPTPLTEVYSETTGTLVIETTHFNDVPSLVPRMPSSVIPYQPLLVSSINTEFRVKFLRPDGSIHTGPATTEQNFFWSKRKTGAVKWGGSDGDDVIFLGTKNIWVLAVHFG